LNVSDIMTQWLNVIGEPPEPPFEGMLMLNSLVPAPPNPLKNVYKVAASA
jgi:hypothetical protein